MKDFEKEGAVFADVAEKMILENRSLKEALGLSSKEMDDLYSQAYHHYRAGNYSEAIKTFQALAACDNTDERYVMGLAASYHLKKEYKEAIRTYMLGSLLNPESPVPLYHISDCCIQLQDQASALLYLEMAIKRCGNNKAYAEIKEKSKLIIDNIIKQTQ